MLEFLIGLKVLKFVLELTSAITAIGGAFSFSLGPLGIFTTALLAATAAGEGLINIARKLFPDREFNFEKNMEYGNDAFIAKHGSENGYTVEQIEKARKHVEELNKKYNGTTQGENLNSLLDAIEKQESGGNPNAVSSKGAQGAFQFMPDTFAQYGNGGNIWNEKDSRDAASRLLQHLLLKYKGNIQKALAGYNWGEGNVDKLGSNFNIANLPLETQDYISKIIPNLNKNLSSNDRYSNSSSGATINQTNNIHITGATDPSATASKVGITMNSVNENVVRNLRGAVMP